MYCFYNFPLGLCCESGVRSLPKFGTVFPRSAGPGWWGALHAAMGRGDGHMVQPRLSSGLPPAQGLYDPSCEHDGCGVGFVVDIKGRKSHAIVSQALGVLKNLLHRGACGCEPNTGDGAGILIQMPHAFLSRECGRLGVELPAPGHYGAGLVFLPRDPAQAATCRGILEQIVHEEGQTILGWREVPTDDSPVGPTARSVEPVMKQVF